MIKKFIENNCTSYDSEIIVCSKLIETFGGNIIEIGAGVGESTAKFLEISREYNVKTIVIDPFEDGWDEMPPSYGRPYPYSTFVKNTLFCKDNLILHKVSSQTDGLIELLQNEIPYSFSFVDGLQYDWAVLNDLNLMDSLKCRVICVDDYERLTDVSQVRIAVDEFLKTKNYDLVVNLDPKRIRTKAFLIRNDD